MNILTKAIKALNKINKDKLYRDYAKIMNNTKLSDWGGIKPSLNDLQPFDIFTLGKIEEIEENMPQPVEQVQIDWNQNDTTKLDYIKNRPFYETTTPLFPDTQFKFNENGSLQSVVIVTDAPVLVEGDIVEFTSLNPELEVRYGGSSFSPDGKSGSFGFAVYDLNGSNQGGGGGSLSYNGDTEKYIFSISGSGNHAVCANLEFKMFSHHKTKLSGDFINIDNLTLQVDGSTGYLKVNKTNILPDDSQKSWVLEGSHDLSTLEDSGTKIRITIGSICYKTFSNGYTLYRIILNDLCFNKTWIKDTNMNVPAGSIRKNSGYVSTHVYDKLFAFLDNAPIIIPVNTIGNLYFHTNQGYIYVNFQPDSRCANSYTSGTTISVYNSIVVS